MKNLVQDCLEAAGFAVLRRRNFDTIKRKANAFDRYRFDLDFLRSVDSKHRGELIDLIPESKSQLRQDLFVLATLNFHVRGYFVEFGATNGVEKSNSFLLERHFDWTGILSEPGRQWHSALEQNRKCIIEKKCVWRASGEKLLFNETENGEFSTIDSFTKRDRHRQRRKTGARYDVETISLNDLLAFHQAPNQIDYLSVDTEGSEFEILNAVDYDKYRFKVITVEHNQTENKDKIRDLLISKGYRLQLDGLAQIEDWFVLGE